MKFIFTHKATVQTTSATNGMDSAIMGLLVGAEQKDFKKFSSAVQLSAARTAWGR